MRSWPAKALAVVLGAVLLVGVGRWERQRQVNAQVRGMKHVEALVGTLDGKSLSGYRADAGFYCLTYRRGANACALELCTDHDGHVIEAIDRRSDHRHIWSLRFAPGSSTLKLPWTEMRSILRRIAWS